MRVFDNGSLYSVTVFQREVETFKNSWPCSTLPDAAITFQFDKRNGDLVDITPYQLADRVSGDDAVALSQDAQAYGAKRLKLEAI